MDRRSFFKRLCILAAAPLAAALPAKPKAREYWAGTNVPREFPQPGFCDVSGTRYVHDDLYAKLFTPLSAAYPVNNQALRHELETHYYCDGNGHFSFPLPEMGEAAVLHLPQGCDASAWFTKSFPLYF